MVAAGKSARQAAAVDQEAEVARLDGQLRAVTRLLRAGGAREQTHDNKCECGDVPAHALLPPGDLRQV
jgi:hypothetical protein